MLCKCGATVKASGDAAGMTLFVDQFWADSEAVARQMRKNGRPRAEPPATGNARQDCGTIDVRSNEDIIASGVDERRSLLRSNNIRRSKALERIYGKRWNTFSRITG